MNLLEKIKKTKVLSWIRIFGVVLISTSLILIFLDLLDMKFDLPIFKQHEPPTFFADWVPNEIIFCKDKELKISSKEVFDSIEIFNNAGWPIWKTEISFKECDLNPAPPGVLTIRKCGLRSENRVLVPACPGEVHGATWAQVEFNPNKIIAVDIYLQKKSDQLSLYHEMGHARGYLDKDGGSSHSTDPDDFMFTFAGTKLDSLKRDNLKTK